MEQTLTDRIVGYFSPSAGIERFKARTMLALAGGGYEGGRRDRRSMRKWRPFEQSANADTVPDLSDLRSRSRDLVRNTPIATGALATVVTNVVGDGLSLQSVIDREALGLDEAAASAWQKQAEREWEVWCKTADFSRHQNFYELQGLAYRSERESGDVLVVRRFRKDAGDAYGTKIQLIESDRISNPNRSADKEGLVGGVEYDAESGAVLAYHVANRHPNDYTLNRTALSWRRVPARDPETGKEIAFLLFARTRVDLLRGVPWLAPVIETVRQLGQYTKAEAAAAVIGAMFTVFVTNPGEDGADQPVVGSDSSDTGVERGRELALESEGAIIELGGGQKVEVANPGRPNTAFDGFVSSLCQHIGVALELPYELVIKRFQASYSASRAALETAWQFFRKQRSLFAWRLCQTAYEWVIEEAAATGRIEAQGFFDDPMKREAWLGSEWTGPSRINLDPKKEAEADKIDLDMGSKTLKQITMERTGGTWDGKLEQRAKEIALAPKPAQAPAANESGGNDDEPPPNPDRPEREDEA